VDYVYAGDLKGNLWKFDLTADSSTRWGIAYGEDLNGDGTIDAAQNDHPQPVFQAQGQSITSRPDIMRSRSICAADAPGYIVIFGTGKFLGASDRYDRSLQSIYAIWDYGDDSDDSEFLGHLTDRTDGLLSSGLRLEPRHIISQRSADGQAYREISNRTLDYTLTDDDEDGDHTDANNGDTSKQPNPQQLAGWYLDFPTPPDPNAEPGERVICPVIIRGGNAVVTSFAPDATPCSGGGVTWVYLLSGCSGNDQSSDGTESNTPDAAGLPLIPSHAVRYPGHLTSSLSAVKETPFSKLDQIILSDQAGRIRKQDFVGEKWGKVFWRQNPQ
jgi:type IV pilus assembly protein PilY1